MINRILAAGEKSLISHSKTLLLGAVLEYVYRMLGVKSEPRMTHFPAREFSIFQWFGINAARKVLGYASKIPLARDWNDRSDGFHVPPPTTEMDPIRKVNT